MVQYATTLVAKQFNPDIFGCPTLPLAKSSPRAVSLSHEKFEPALEGKMLDDRYLVTKEIGRGAVGVVYRTIDLEENSHVAIKVMPKKISSWEFDLQSLQSKVDILRRINHKNVVAIKKAGSHSDMQYIVMEYMKGNDLESLMEREKVFRWSAAKDVIIQVCAGLGALHEQGMAHHDVKPSNIFITEDNTVKVFDFDFSVFTLFELSDSGKTTTGKLFGTPQYLAPEKIFDISDHRVDVFSVGVILYEMLTGTLPFDGENHIDTLQAVMHLDPLLPSAIRLGLTPQIDAIVMRALEKDPSKRYQSMGEMAAAISACGNGQKDA